MASMRKKGGPEKKDPPRNSGGLPPASRRPAGLRKFCETMVCWSATPGGSRDNSARRGPRERSAKPPRHSDKQKNLEPLRQPDPANRMRITNKYGSLKQSVAKMLQNVATFFEISQTAAFCRSFAAAYRAPRTASRTARRTTTRWENLRNSFRGKNITLYLDPYTTIHFFFAHYTISL